MIFLVKPDLKNFEKKKLISPLPLNNLFATWSSASSLPHRNNDRGNINIFQGRALNSDKNSNINAP